MGLRPVVGALHLRHPEPARAAGGDHRAFLGTEATILYSSCFDANGGLFETLLGPEDAVISDALNHASIIDGIRLCKAQRYRYRNCDMADLESKLQEAKGARTRLIATDGAFSMDGVIAPLADICDLAERYDALVLEVRPQRVLEALESGQIALVAGFQGVSTEDEGDHTWKGGSDTTAVALAHALRASVCEIYTDVDGVYTANPRVGFGQVRGASQRSASMR